MNYIYKNVLEKELFYENTVVLKYYIEYPSVSLGTQLNRSKNI